MSAPRDINLGGVPVAPFVRYLFLVLVIPIAARFVVGRLGLRSTFANPTCGGGPVRLHPRVSHRILDLSDAQGALNRCEPRFVKM